MRYVYFARIVGTEGPIKIGCSSSPAERCKQLGFDLAMQVELIAKAPGDLWLERNLHIKLSAHRTQAPQREGKTVPGATEWFAPCSELLRLIDEVKSGGGINLRIEDCREQGIAARYKAGHTLEQIAQSYGITRERVRQILNSLGIQRRTAAERAYIDRLAREERYREWRARCSTAA